jgi:hypothetical protein
MLVAYSAMSTGNVKAVDQVIKIVRELDRYRGFGAYPSPERFVAPLPAEPPPLALPQPPAALAPPEIEEAGDGAAATEPRDLTPREDGAIPEWGGYPRRTLSY